MFNTSFSNKNTIKIHTHTHTHTHTYIYIYIYIFGSDPVQCIFSFESDQSDWNSGTSLKRNPWTMKHAPLFIVENGWTMKHCSLAKIMLYQKLLLVTRGCAQLMVGSTTKKLWLEHYQKLKIVAMSEPHL